MAMRNYVFLLLSVLLCDIPCCSAQDIDIPKDVLFLIDGSGSVKPHNFNKLRTFLKNIVDGFKIGGPTGTNVAVIQFSSRSRTKVEFNLDSFDNKDDIKRAIDDIVYQRRWTYTGYGMKMARKEVFNGRGGDRPNAKNVLLVFTDGEAADQYAVREESQGMKNGGTHVMAIGFGPMKNVERFKHQLDDMATNMNKDVFLRGFEDLDKIERRLKEAVMPKADCSTSPCKNGGRCNNVGDSFKCDCTEDYEGLTCEKKKGPCWKKPCLNDGVCEERGDDFKCTCSEQWYGKQCQKEKVVCTTSNSDILFILDGSRSITSSDFIKMKKFVTQLVYRFNISRYESHVAVMQYGEQNRIRLEFNLNGYYSKSNIMRRLDAMVLLKGESTYTGAALRAARRRVFNGRGGDRKDVRNVIILLTDGSAHDKEEALKEATKLKDDDVSIISIGVGKGESDDAFLELLEAIASSLNYVFKVSFAELETILDGVTKAACENLRDI